MELTGSWYGVCALLLFVFAYATVMAEETLHLRKSKPVLVAAGMIWLLVALAYHGQGDTHTPVERFREYLLEYAELFLFLLAAMTFINTLEERQVFNALRAWLVARGFMLRTVYWLTGLLAFCISPIADNLTTTLLMAAVVMAVGRGNRCFLVVACINIVVAANAGGAFSPFGDITTLMVWQSGKVNFVNFFQLFLPAAVNWLVPALLMAPAVPKGRPEAGREVVRVRQGGIVVMSLFLVTIGMAVSFHQVLHLPPVLGMMTGLGLLKFYGYQLKVASIRGPEGNAIRVPEARRGNGKPFDIFESVQRAEWDTLMFFYGVILCVGGLGTLGYLSALSGLMYNTVGPTWANIGVGLLSSVVDNIPVMFAVLKMNPDMGLRQWLLVTLTTGIGGSLLSIGSAAGVALMGQARGIYTFVAHLRWSWAIALGYVASIQAYLMLNRAE